MARLKCLDAGLGNWGSYRRAMLVSRCVASGYGNGQLNCNCSRQLCAAAIQGGQYAEISVQVMYCFDNYRIGSR